MPLTKPVSISDSNSPNLKPLPLCALSHVPDGRDNHQDMHAAGHSGISSLCRIVPRPGPLDLARLYNLCPTKLRIDRFCLQVLPSSSMRDSCCSSCRPAWGDGCRFAAREKGSRSRLGKGWPGGFSVSLRKQNRFLVRSPGPRTRETLAALVDVLGWLLVHVVLYLKRQFPRRGKKSTVWFPLSELVKGPLPSRFEVPTPPGHGRKDAKKASQHSATAPLRHWGNPWPASFAALARRRWSSTLYRTRQDRASLRLRRILRLRPIPPTWMWLPISYISFLIFRCSHCKTSPGHTLGPWE